MKQLVVGLGESGLAMVRHSVRMGVPVVVYDSRLSPAQLPVLRECYSDVPFFCGEFKAEYLNEITQIAISPGLSPHLSPLKDILGLAAEQNINIIGELDLFARALQNLQCNYGYAPKVLAVTGTNGKTTVTALTRHLCEASGVYAVAAGNISPSMLDALCDAEQSESLPDVWVLELSSFQLQFAQEFSPHAATVLNITQDHLDWHSDMAEYIAAKAKIFGTQTIRILNRDDANVYSMMQEGSLSYSFGQSKPSAPNQYGLWLDSAMSWLSTVSIKSNEESHKKRNKFKAEPLVDVETRRLMPMDALKIRGRHNAMNALAALALCRAINIPLAKLLHGLRTYEGEPHRVQFVTQVNGVDFYDDSKGTNVGATLAALQGLGQPIVLIAGGDGKGQDFGPLLSVVKQYVKRVDLIGKDAQRMKDSLVEAGIPMDIHISLEEATVAAAKSAVVGDAVLLSPACASLDMFKNYAHRAQVFCDAVYAWAQDQGQVS